MRTVKPVAVVLSILLLLAMAVIGLGVWQVDRFMTTPVFVGADAVEFEIPAGSSFASVAQRLVD